METKPKTESKWRALAAQLEKTLLKELPGKRDAKLILFAEENQIAPITLRFYIAAHRFLTRLSEVDPDLAKQLEIMPIDVSNVVSRWSRYDPSAAREAAQKFVDGRIRTVRDLQRLEKAARLDEKAGTTPKLALRAQIEEKRSLYVGNIFESKNNYIVATQQQFEKLWSESGKELNEFRGQTFPIGGAFANPTPEERRFLRVDLVAGSLDSRLLLLIVGPYSRAENETNRAPEWILKSVAVNRLSGEPVGLILPTGAQEDVFVKSLEWVERTETARAEALLINKNKRQVRKNKRKPTGKLKENIDSYQKYLNIYLIRFRTDGFELLRCISKMPTKNQFPSVPNADARKIWQVF